MESVSLFRVSRKKFQMKKGSFRDVVCEHRRVFRVVLSHLKREEIRFRLIFFDEDEDRFLAWSAKNFSRRIGQKFQMKKIFLFTGTRCGIAGSASRTRRSGSVLYLRRDFVTKQLFADPGRSYSLGLDSGSDPSHLKRFNLFLNLKLFFARDPIPNRVPGNRIDRDRQKAVSSRNRAADIGSTRIGACEMPIRRSRIASQ